MLSSLVNHYKTGHHQLLAPYRLFDSASSGPGRPWEAGVLVQIKFPITYRMAPSTASNGPNPLCNCVIAIAVVAFMFIATSGLHTYRDIHNGVRLVVVGNSFHMNRSMEGNATLGFTLRAVNPAFSSISYDNITGTLAVLNKDPFLKFHMKAFHVKKRNFVESRTQVTATQLSMPDIDTANNSIALVLMLNGTMETSSRSYICYIWNSEEDEACWRV
ncbi:unnamed protein product [Alopecurus aequalis]